MVLGIRFWRRARSLDDGQRRALAEHGFLVAPGVIPPARVAAAVGAIDRSLARGLRAEDVPRFRASSFCPELRSEPVVLDLLRSTPAWEIAESLLGRGRIAPVRQAQIALSFPAPERPRETLTPHVDGLHYPGNDVPSGTVASFTALVSVLLSDVLAPAEGNLVVWPGSHRALAAHLRVHGPGSLARGMPALELGDPQPVVGRAGDLVIAHYLLAHAAGPNTSSRLRYAVYFRLKHAAHDRAGLAGLPELWRDWPGMQAARIS